MAGSRSRRTARAGRVVGSGTRVRRVLRRQRQNSDRKLTATHRSSSYVVAPRAAMTDVSGSCHGIGRPRIARATCPAKGLMPNRNTIDDAGSNRETKGAEQPNRERRKTGAPRGGTPRISPRISPHHARRQSTSPAPARRSTTRFDSHTLPATALLRNGKREMKPNKGHSWNHEPRARSATEAASGAALKRANTECAPSQAAGCSRSHVAAFSFSALSSIAALDITEK